MGILDFFLSKPASSKHSANKAKERLQIIVAHERKERQMADFIPKLKEEILQVVRKYVAVSDEQIDIHLDKKNADCTVLELNVSLPEK